VFQNIKKGIDKRKIRVFFLFLLASSLIWFLSTLSQTYTAKTVFNLNYRNSDKGLRLTKAFTDQMDVRLQTVGFQFFGFSFKKKAVTLDLAKVEKVGDRYFLPPDEYRNQIEKQLSSSMRLLEIDSDTLFFNFLEMVSKEIPVESDIKIKLAHNFLLDGPLKIEPSTVTITGPKNEIDTILTAHLEKLDLPEMATDFSAKTYIFKSSELKYTSYSSEAVQIKGKVSKFSEKIVDVPIQVINQPAGRVVRTFPDVVSILCKAKIEQLKNIGSGDFKVIADYSESKNARSNILALKIEKKPTEIFTATLMETKVEYILNKK